MGTLLLFDSASETSADGWRQVAGPGGYEGWHFDAEDAAGRLVVATFFQGYPFHPEYLRRYFAYRRRPTRCTPPLPVEYPAVHLAIYQNGKCLDQATMQYPPAAFAASERTIAIGPSRFTHDDGQTIVQARGGDQSLAVDLVFRPRLAFGAVECCNISRQISGAEHRWIVAHPLCDVSGQIKLAGEKTIDFEGLGYRDHCLGTGPIGPGLLRWMRGRILLPWQTMAFQMAQPSDGVLESHLLLADAQGLAEIPVAGNWICDRRSRWGLVYPSAVEFGREVMLRNPRVLESSPFRVRAIFDAYMRQETARAFCEIVQPQRLRGPLLGAWIARSIRRGDYLAEESMAAGVQM